jgi:hypothetical protein
VTKSYSLFWKKSAEKDLRHLPNAEIARIISAVEKLPEGVYLATSDEVQGLVAQGRTLWETMEIARDVGHKLLDAQKERSKKHSFKQITRHFDHPLVLEY